MLKKSQSISFRLPVDIEEELFNKLATLKANSNNFSKDCFKIFLKGLEDTTGLQATTGPISDKKNIYVQLPYDLSDDKLDWVQQEITQKVIGAIVYSLIEEENFNVTTRTSSANSSSIKEKTEEITISSGEKQMLSYLESI